MSRSHRSASSLHGSAWLPAGAIAGIAGVAVTLVAGLAWRARRGPASFAPGVVDRLCLGFVERAGTLLARLQG